jgi:transposase InsO family protein
MATELKTVAIIPLNGSNYVTWKVQCRMALMKDGLWSIVSGSEGSPSGNEAESAKFRARRDRALATIVLSIEPSLLYLIGDPEDPVVVWQRLADQFQKKTWANKLSLRRRLYSLHLNDGESVQEHIKAMTEIFDGLSVVGDPVTEEDRVVHLLASLPDSYSMLVTALEANADVPKMEIVTERLLHEERKLKDKVRSDEACEKAFAAKQQQLKRKGPTCHHCGKFGHIRRNCWELTETAFGPNQKEKKSFKQKANKVHVRRRDSSSSEAEGVGLTVCHALSASARNQSNSWIVDSGATSHMCNERKFFVEFRNLEPTLQVTLGDGHELQAAGQGTVELEITLAKGVTKKCKLYDALYVPKLSYNLISVSKSTETGKTITFGEAGCQILDRSRKLIAAATKVGNLYYLDCCVDHQQVHSVEKGSHEAKENVWHRRFGHLGVCNLEKLAKDKLVDGFDYDVSKEFSFCESCVEGKHHRCQFPTNGGKRYQEPLGLVHSDVCGKMNAQSLSGAEYFLTFIDDKTRYVWIYVLKRKDQVFERFLEWKAQVEKTTGQKVKALRTDNGGEYTSAEFKNYLRTEGIRHELTVPKTPEQNGVAERMNRTLIENVRSMLADAKLPHKFWAEALSTAVYLRNRSPATAVEGMTPYEAWTGEKPNVKHLRVFGCLGYVHIPKDARQKLDSKARKCVFLGYGTETKGYRLYDPKHTRVLRSRDVVFNESKQGFEKELEDQKETRFVELDYLDDEEPVTEEMTEPVVRQLEETADQVLRRSGRERRQPEHYGEWLTIANDSLKEPATVEEALASPEKIEWMSAMEKEMNSLYANEVYDLVELPKGRRVVGSKWVFKRKMNADGSVERYKARLVAQGFSQKPGLDYDETFSPVVRLESLRTMIALAVQNDMKLHQMDVTTAFLNGILKEEVYMKQPEGFITKGQEHLVCNLKRSIYGLKQSPRCWNSALDDSLKKMGFVQTASDPCLYVSSEGDLFMIGVHVDDIILAGKSNRRIAEVKEDLAHRFEVKDMGELHYFLGLKVVQGKNCVWIGQPGYVDSILQKFGMENAKSIDTPIDASVKLVKATEESDNVDQVLYQSAVGSLLYLSIGTRPDITYAVSSVGRFCAKPTKQHWMAVKRIMRYLKGTLNFGLLYKKSGLKDCIGYSDSDWAGDIDDRRSTSGYLFLISGTAISWRSKKQTCVALSTAEAEYMALASAAQEAIWLRQLVTDLRNEPTEPTLILEDNQAAICIAKDPQFHGRAKHIDIKYHFIREQVNNGTVELRYCRTDDMTADMLTKGLSRDQFIKLREMAGVKPLDEHFACK